MGFLSGNLACTRFNVTSQPEEVNFEAAAFRLISRGSNITESMGFVPFEIEEPYEIGKRRYAFRVRIDKISVDATAVKERWRELIKTEVEMGHRVGPKAKKRLKDLAEQEILAVSAPRSKIIEGVLDNDTLYVGSTSKGHLGTVLQLLQSVGVEVEFKTPWLDAGMEEDPSQLVEPKEPGQSLFGCQYIKKLMDDPEIMVEPEKGSVKLVAANHAKVTLTGEVLGELERYIEEGAEILSAKMIMVEVPLSLDGFAYRINGLKLETVKADHWTEILDERLEMLKGVWDKLDEKFEKAMDITLPKRQQMEITPVNTPEPMPEAVTEEEPDAPVSETEEVEAEPEPTPEPEAPAAQAIAPEPVETDEDDFEEDFEEEVPPF